MPINQSTARKRWNRHVSNAAVEMSPATTMDVVEMVSAMLGITLGDIERFPTSTAELVSADPVWRRRLRASLEEMREGRTRSIEEYWAEDA